MPVPTFTKTGTKATTAAKLDKRVFEVTVENHNLLKDAYVAYLANGRKQLAVTKTRAEVSGGGRKPWQQKGTGRARTGSSRNPIWRGGGIAFGPTGNENYRKSLNIKAKRLALRQALSLAATENKIRVIETFDCKDGKVSKTVALLKKLDASGRVLLAVSQKDDLVERATGNLQSVKAVHANYLNVFDILNADVIVFDQKALDAVTQWLGSETPAAKGGDK
jgi:large subunit ribosomal protein L4